MKSQYNTKYTNLLVLFSLVTIFIFFFIDNAIVESVSFTVLALLLTLNFYEAYIADNKEKHKVKLGLSALAFVIFIGYTIWLLLV